MLEQPDTPGGMNPYNGSRRKAWWGTGEGWAILSRWLEVWWRTRWETGRGHSRTVATGPEQLLARTSARVGLTHYPRKSEHKGWSGTGRPGAQEVATRGQSGAGRGHGEDARVGHAGPTVCTSGGLSSGGPGSGDGLRGRERKTAQDCFFFREKKWVIFNREAKFSSNSRKLRGGTT